RAQRDERLEAGPRIADLRLLRRLGRVIAERRDRDHLFAGADREQHLGDARRERHDARGRLGQKDFTAEVVDKRALGKVRHEGHAGENALLATSHGLVLGERGWRQEGDERGGNPGGQRHGLSPTHERKRLRVLPAGFLARGRPTLRAFPSPRRQWHSRISSTYSGGTARASHPLPYTGGTVEAAL